MIETLQPIVGAPVELAGIAVRDVAAPRTVELPEGGATVITQQAGAPQHAMIRIRPLLDLLTLREVMVMNKLDLPQQQPQTCCRL